MTQQDLGNSAIRVGRVSVAPAALRIKYSRSSGPGGQNVNKVNTRCELWVKIDDIVGLTFGAQARLRTLAGSKLTMADEIHQDCSESRSQEGNREAAIERLRDLIVKAMHEPKKRRATKPSYGAKQRRLQSKKRTSEIKSNRRSVDHG